MSLRKSTRIEDYRMIHVWDDVEVGFHIEASKREHTWQVDTNEFSKTFDRYQNAVDFVMDEWRLVKSGHGSWEEIAAAMAADQGYDWESLDDDVAKDFLDAARQGARFGAL